MIFTDTKLNVIIGAYGSGKSEIAVNAAIFMRENMPDRKILLADMDIVNPFYRSADAADVLAEHDVRTVLPSYAGSNVDAPVLSGEMYAIFDDERYSGVYDIGGEDMGATILGSLHSRLMGIDHKLIMVVNTLRPFTSTAEEIAVMTVELSGAANLKVDGYINNTNLLEETAGDMVLAGEDMILKASELTGVPLLATAAMEEVWDSIDESKIKAPDKLKLRRIIHYNY